MNNDDSRLFAISSSKAKAYRCDVVVRTSTHDSEFKISPQGTINKTIYMDEILTDLNHVLSMDADHVAGLILRGSFDPKEQEQKLYTWKACRKNPDAQVFIPITDLNHPDINRLA